ncbi:MAG TPA: adenine phosphoribosyltransferase [Kiritimatiellae bacterium]|nr:adenine phosphoribosyltransferase [Kiritimatiellia bacterium]
MNAELRDRVKAAIRDVPDFPRKGILFRDITPVLQSPGMFRRTIDFFFERYHRMNIEAVAAVESRGFIFGGALSYRLGCSFVPVRKAGKLPWATVSESYELEYGSATLEVHRDALGNARRVLIFDDLLATGGTAAATARLLEQLGGTVVEIAFLIELADLKGRGKLQSYPVFSLVQF